MSEGLRAGRLSWGAFGDRVLPDNRELAAEEKTLLCAALSSLCSASVEISHCVFFIFRSP